MRALSAEHRVKHLAAQNESWNTQLIACEKERKLIQDELNKKCQELEETKSELEHISSEDQRHRQQMILDMDNKNQQPAYYEDAETCRQIESLEKSVEIYHKHLRSAEADNKHLCSILSQCKKQVELLTMENHALEERLMHTVKNRKGYAKQINLHEQQHHDPSNGESNLISKFKCTLQKREEAMHQQLQQAHDRTQSLQENLSASLQENNMLLRQRNTLGVEVNVWKEKYADLMTYKDDLETEYNLIWTKNMLKQNEVNTLKRQINEGPRTYSRTQL